MEQIQEKINSLNVRDTTKKGHIDKLKFLYNHLNDTIYKDIDAVKLFINSRYDNPNTKRNYYDSLFNLTGYKEYLDEMNIFIKENDKKRLNNVLTDKQKENWMTLEELKAVPNVLEDIIVEKYNKLWLLTYEDLYTFKKPERQKYVRLMLDYIMLMVNIHHPVRLDYYNVKFIFKEENVNKTDNFILVKKDSMELHMNHYKNSGKYTETNIQTLSPTLYTCLKNWIKLYDTAIDEMPEYLIYRIGKNLKMNPIANRGTYGIILNGVVEKYAGKHITINTIRKIHESDLIQSDEYKEMTNAEKKELHGRLLHSHSSAIVNYNMIKIDDFEG